MKCPVCGEPVEDLKHHLESHSKDELIKTLIEAERIIRTSVGYDC